MGHLKHVILIHRNAQKIRHRTNWFWVTTELLPFVDHFHRVMHSKFLSSNIHEMKTHLFVVNFEFVQKKEHFYVENFTCTCLWFIHIVSFQSCVDISKGLNFKKVVNILKNSHDIVCFMKFFLIIQILLTCK